MRIQNFIALGVAAVFVALPLTAAAKDNAPLPEPAAWKELMKCKEVADPDSRLACFDAATGKLESATRDGEVVVTDRAAVRESRKGLFGFKLPSLGLFGGKDDDKDEEAKSLDGSIASARQFGYGRWRMTLADGSIWEQIDEEGPLNDPAAGNPVNITKGAMGSYWMKIAGSRQIRVRRIQ